MLNERGHEIPDPNPLVRPLHLSQQETLAEKIKRMVRYELSQAAEANGHETFEEADDFDVDDDPELKSAYELSEDYYDRPTQDRQPTVDPHGPDPGVREELSQSDATGKVVAGVASPVNPSRTQGS